METLNFDQINVSAYDETRNTNPQKLAELLTYICAEYPSVHFMHGIEIGVGTGRIAVPMAQLGYKISGVDVSVEMTGILKQKIKKEKLENSISIHMESATSLPFNDNTFDFGMAVHVFHLIADWKKAVRELIRVVKNGHPIFLIYNNGKSLMKGLKHRYEQKCLHNNVNIEVIGTFNKEQVLDYFVELGCAYALERGRWKWKNEMSFNQLLAILKARTYSFTTIAPEEIHDCAIDEIRNELLAEGCNLEAMLASESELMVATIKTL